jgi:ABC-2 type transport system permease protein
MWAQIVTIAWAQLRTMRNHLPRTNLGSVLVWLFSLLWYGMFASIGIGLGIELPSAPIADLRRALPAGLLFVFLFWQLIPLFTLSSGWSLQLNKLRMYPVRNSALFGIEVLLRVTSAPEMILVLAGGCIGLLRHPQVPLLWPIFLLLYIPLNLFLALAIRELFVQSFARNRYRELFAILLLSIAVLPQLLLRTALGEKAKPWFWVVALGQGMPWHDVAMLSLGAFSWARLGLLFVWTFLCYRVARWQFAKSLREEEAFGAGAASRPAKRNQRENLLTAPSRLFGDPMAALLEKEFRSLVRMPRFRVLFGMACVFSVVIFLPRTMQDRGDTFLNANVLPLINLYGLLILSDALLLNAFGFDRKAAQIYFVTPVRFDLILKAKNLTAITFVLLQAITVVIVAAVMRVKIGPRAIADAAGATAVVGLFLLSLGNLLSIAMPRPIDPTQTFRKQAGGKMQLWLLLCAMGMFLLMAFAFLAQWALESHWALIGVLALEFAIGLIVYKVALDSAVQRGLLERERIIEALSKGTSPVELGM